MVLATAPAGARSMSATRLMIPMASSLLMGGGAGWPQRLQNQSPVESPRVNVVIRWQREQWSARESAIDALQRRLHLRFAYPSLRYRVVRRVDLNADKVPARLDTSDAGGAGAHERVKDGRASVNQ